MIILFVTVKITRIIYDIFMKIQCVGATTICTQKNKGVMLLIVGVFNDYVTHALTVGSIIYSVWTSVGYKCKWKHM